MIKKFTFLLLLSIFIVGCSKDDKKKNGETNLNTFSINDVEYTINVSLGFYFESIGQSGDELFNFQAGGNDVEDFFIGFSICWKNSIDMVEGNYIKTDEDPGWRFECSNIDISDTEFEDFATGTLIVTPLNDSMYRVEFDGTTDAGSSVTIFFEQPIQIID